MTAQDYIQTKLDDLKNPLDLIRPRDDASLVDTIYKAVTSKKFRKYSLQPEHAEHIRAAIALNVKAKKPIQLTLVFGGYKLWRLQETPEVDWAELFSLMYYTNWMKPICELYEPGVWFDFYSDDVIVPQMNNVPAEGTAAYQASFRELLDFIKPYQPQNLNMTLNRVGDQYENDDAFQQDLQTQIASLAASLEGGLPVLTDTMRAVLDLNVSLKPGQADDPQWREKVQLIHDGYAQVTGRRPYYRKPDKINVMTTPFGGMLAVGTTKDSIMKFWIGAGVLRPDKEDFRQIILSPGQLEKASFDLEPVVLTGLDSKNFQKVRILK